MAIAFSFNLPRTLQAVGVILRKHHGRMDRVRLLKLLYIIDRELLIESGRTLTGDRAVAMPRGPVLMQVYDLIKGLTPLATKWNESVVSEDFEVCWKTDASDGLGKLNRAELEKLDEVCHRYRNFDSEELSEHTHEFAEWIATFDPHNPQDCRAISWEQVLESQGRKDLIEEITEMAEDHALADAAFGG
jgi:uncharacterized phage-associated protein